MHFATREIDVMSGKDCICSLEARYTFTITKGRKADRISPAEEPSVEIVEVEARFHPSQPWSKVDKDAQHMLIADIPDAWFIEQALEGAA